MPSSADMPNPSVFAATARFIGRVGNQAAVSLAASAAAAACLALPSLVAVPARPSEMAVAASEPMAWASPVAPDGKIRERHHDATGGEGLVQVLSGRGLVGTAAIIMPMSLGWTQPDAEPPAPIRVAAVQTADPAPAVVKIAQALPPRRPPDLGERPRPATDPMSEPLQLADAGAAEGLRPPATILGRVVPAPVGYIGSTVSGAVGLVGAAGSWTVARAASLVPRL